MATSSIRSIRKNSDGTGSHQMFWHAQTHSFTLISLNPRRPKSIAMIKCGPDDEWMGVNGSSVGIDERFKSDLTSL